MLDVFSARCFFPTFLPQFGAKKLGKKTKVEAFELGQIFENQKVGASFLNFYDANFNKLIKLGQSCENFKSWSIRVGAKKKEFK